MSNLTNTIGYFNPNTYPMNVSLPEVNLILELQPKCYVVDRTGRLVNDPILDRFVGRGRLARASDPKQQTEVILLRAVNDSTAAAPAAHQHSVSQAQSFAIRDGRVVPVNLVSTAPQPVTPPPQSYNPVRGYTVEEAKKLRMIKPTREVPDDFGADETTGAPKSGQEIPSIRYATDTVRGRKPAPLPEELAAPATPQQAAIIASLNKAASVDLTNPNVVAQVTRQVVSEATAAPVVAKPFTTLSNPAPDSATPPAPKRLVPPPIPVNPKPTLMTVLPPPVLDDLPTESSLVVEEELGEPESPVPATVVEDRVDAARHLPPPESVHAEISCPLCPSKSFAGRGWFLRHVRRFHSGKEAELMAPYPGA